MTLPTAPSRTMNAETFDTTTDAFIGALPQFEIDMNALAAAMNLNDTTDTSVSSVAIGTGAKSFTVSSGKSFWPGMWLVIADTAAPTTNAMFCQVTSYSGTALVVNSYAVQGSGTIASWQISQSAPAALDGLYAQVAGATFTGLVNFKTGATFTGLVNFKTGATFTGLVNFKTGANIASAATIDLSAATGNLVHITGTTPISAVTMTAGQWMRCIADGALPLTYHATTNRISGGVDYTCMAGDTIDYFYDGTTVIGNITKKDWAASETVSGIVELATTTEATAGTDTSRAVTAAGLEAHMVGNALGWGQTWQNVTGSRAKLTPYYNTTGRPIMVTIYASASNIYLTVDGVNVASCGGNPTYGTTISAIVPSGSVYKWNSADGNIINWAELR